MKSGQSPSEVAEVKCCRLCSLSFTDDCSMFTDFGVASGVVAEIGL